MDEKQSFFTRFRSYGVKINSSLIHNTEVEKDRCNCKKKSFFASLFDRSEKVCEDPRTLKNSCPDKGFAKKENFIQTLPESSCAKKSMQKAQKKQIHVIECNIREQNPLSPCCCMKKSANDDDDDGTPCPPNYFPEPRPPTCECDLCRKSGYHCRCCNRGTYIRGCAESPPQFENA